MPLFALHFPLCLQILFKMLLNCLLRFPYQGNPLPKLCFWGPDTSLHLTFFGSICLSNQFSQSLKSDTTSNCLYSLQALCSELTKNKLQKLSCKPDKNYSTRSCSIVQTLYNHSFPMLKLFPSPDHLSSPRLFIFETSELILSRCESTLRLLCAALAVA